ncbi:Gfo/Idh/MocA family protein [Kribbella speibonae]|uniref:Gfo/Idh/MocA family oxidoreductase n=1 Tax=Kribbella speibonae TaxID=1572660 RepID=A0A4R0IQM8_9ACTN|nr:Gfo/Idh/MocA family oxidoreductase [Kribbella speibonae]TCC30955.1 Gfo/Idh/MocA family oxidoreductase [Kribbella speibonae]
MQSTLGVGFLGSGPVTQAIHLPTLARLTDHFTVRHLNDVDAGVAAAVAQPAGTAYSTSLDALLGDPLVDVVAICSPHGFHAEQVIAACRSGKKAVLCEKPLAMSADEAAAIATASAETGVPVLVGSMHVYDPGWRAAVAHWGDLPATCHTIRSSVVLPPNARFEDLATEVTSRPAFPAMDLSDVGIRAGLVHAGVMGLAVHDLPLIRTLLPRYGDLRVISATLLTPFGYRILMVAGGKFVELHAVMSQTWQPRWVLEAYADDQVLHTEFTPSYVHAGSAVSTLTTAETAQVFGPRETNGYEAEWLELAAVVRGEVSPPDLDGLVDDLRFTVAVADAAAEAVRSADRTEAAA